MNNNSNPEHRLTRLQGGLAIAAFASGVIIALICLFLVPPYGEITTSAISIVSELLILCGALLGIKVVFDLKLNHFASELNDLKKKHDEKQF